MAVAEKPQTAEIQGGVGFRIRTDFERVGDDLLAQFKCLETTDIGDALNRLYTVHFGIKPVTELNQRLVGNACTVKVFPGDNLMVHKALDIAKPGDIIVVDSNGYENTAVLGDSITMKAHHRGITGFVVDGLVRDIDGIRRNNLTVFAKGITPNGPLHRGPGEINYPIQCGGVVVNPGDIVVGDVNGVVIIPQNFAQTLVDRLVKKFEIEAAYKRSVSDGHFSNAWVDSTLAQHFCEIV